MHACRQRTAKVLLGRVGVHGYSDDSKSYRVYNPATRRILESRNVAFIETPARLFPPPLEESMQQILSPSNGMCDHNYIAADEFLRGLRYYTTVLEHFPGAFTDHIAMGEISDNPLVAELLERTNEITRGDTLDRKPAKPPQEGGISCGEPTGGFSQDSVLEPQK